MPFGSLPPGPPRRDAADKDEDPQSPDDNRVLFFGRAATTAERREIARLVKQYYAASAAGEGARLCSLLYDLIAETLVEQYASSPGLAGSDCASVASKLLAQRHAELVVDAAALQLTRVRVKGPKAYAMVYFGKRPEPYLVLHRRRGAWRVQTPFAGGLP